MSVVECSRPGGSESGFKRARTVVKAVLLLVAGLIVVASGPSR